MGSKVLLCISSFEWKRHFLFKYLERNHSQTPKCFGSVVFETVSDPMIPTENHSCPVFYLPSYSFSRG